MTFNAFQLTFLFLTAYAVIWLICKAFRIAFGINYIVTVKHDGGKFQNQKKFVVKAFNSNGAYVRAVKLFCKNNYSVKDIYNIDVQVADDAL